MSDRADSTILVVEDEDSFVDALTIGLKREGFRVQVARDGAQALDMFDAVRPDLVLLGSKLRDASGFELCARLRAGSNAGGARGGGGLFGGPAGKSKFALPLPEPFVVSWAVGKTRNGAPVQFVVG